MGTGRLETIFWYRIISEHEIASSGYTVHTLEAAAWCFLCTSTFEDAVVRAANLGDDADTVAAVTGVLAGAYYGYKAIPQRWTERLLGLEEIRQMSTRLVEAPDWQSKEQVEAR